MKPPDAILLARDGEEALRTLADETGHLPAGVLLDLELPKVGGVEEPRRIRGDERTRAAPVVVLTSEAARQLGLYCLVLNRPPPHPDPR
jgi:two-component system response regulator